MGWMGIKCRPNSPTAQQFIGRVDNRKVAGSYPAATKFTALKGTIGFKGSWRLGGNQTMNVLRINLNVCQICQTLSIFRVTWVYSPTRLEAIEVGAGQRWGD